MAISEIAMLEDAMDRLMIHSHLSSLLILLGNSTLNQLEKILEITDSSKVRSDMIEIKSNPVAKIMLESIRVNRKIRIEDLVANTSLAEDYEKGQKQPSYAAKDDAIDFLERLLAFDPDQRYSADMALLHSYLSDFHNPTYEADYSGRPTHIGILNDDKMFSVDRYRVELDGMQKG